MLRVCLFFLSFTSIAFFSISCSSIKKKASNFYLSGFQDKKADKVKYLPPPYPYKKQGHPVLDALWWNPKSKSSISYFSSCSTAHKTLEDFQRSSFPEDGEYKLLENFKTKRNLYSVLEIFGTNQKTYSGIYTLKKGKCYFNINLVAGSKTDFEAEEPVFKTFIKGFRPQ